MSKAVVVTDFIPSDIGHGGYHRTYQIVKTLQEFLGEQNVMVISLDQPLDKKNNSQAVAAKTEKNKRTSLRVSAYRKKEDIKRKLKFIGENPFRFRVNTKYKLIKTIHPAMMQRYMDAVEQIDGSVICIIEQVWYSKLLDFNREKGIPTISCPQNFEALDRTVVDIDDRWHFYANMLDFGNELRAFSCYDARLFISKVETGLANGLGLPSVYYPYLPVDAIKKRCLAIRKKRDANEIDPGLFVMLGSASHKTTRRSFLWFINKALENGLPEGVKVIIGGRDTDKLIPENRLIPGLDVRGWIEQKELDHLLATANAILSPQQTGFGALTRLTEMSCAGIPVIVSRHPTYAMEIPPGVMIAKDGWHGWYEKLKILSQGDKPPKVNYASWEAEQPKPLPEVINGLLQRDR